MNVFDVTIGIYMNSYEHERTENGEPHISKIKQFCDTFVSVIYRTLCMLILDWDVKNISTVGLCPKKIRKMLPRTSQTSCVSSWSVFLLGYL